MFRASNIELYTSVYNFKKVTIAVLIKQSIFSL